ncbi:helix-turn-helix domain-containing protein [Streptomyces sp. NPDC059989]|uniref:MmyB family transcriptional regulator n=1 Tax=Streptomyces sp. NPDC059989 TaxID=3347026 RepID=UPI003686F049
MELPQLLRVWRFDAGIKLRREKAIPQKEVAELMGVSERWYRSLESGDSVSLSSDILGRLSEALVLGPDERMVLYSRALDGAGVALADDEGAAEDQLALLRLVTGQTQFPAYLTDGSWNILGYNTLMATWFPWVREPGANLMHWALTGQEAREQMLDWRRHAEVYLAMLRFALATGSEKASFDRLLQRILRDPVCRELWAQGPKVIAFRQGHRYRLSLPHVSPEQITVTSQVLLPAYQHGMRCVMLLPQTPVLPPQLRIPAQQDASSAE